VFSLVLYVHKSFGMGNALSFAVNSEPITNGGKIMEKLKDIEGRISYGQSDDKARRVLNTSDKLANITAEQIEAGVSIETLEALNVPVYRYGTQITIHGILPNIDRAYVLGYKAVFKNENGTCGVRYIAVDGEKKAILRRLDGLTKCRLGFQSDSTGVNLVKWFTSGPVSDQIAAARELQAAIPQKLFYGGSYIGRGVFGGIVLVVGFNAIPAANLWAFVDWLTFGAVKSSADLDVLAAEKKALREKEDADREAKRAKEAAEKDERQAPILAAAKQTLIDAGYVYYEGPKKEGVFIQLEIPYSSTVCNFYATEFKTFGKRFKKRYARSETLSGLVFGESWKNPDKFYRDTCKGYTLPEKEPAPLPEKPKTKPEEPVACTGGAVQIIVYSEKAIAVTGNTRPIKDRLKACGGRFNPHLTCGAGWIFPKTKEAEVRAVIAA
jgi:hypothetical protein